VFVPTTWRLMSVTDASIVSRTGRPFGDSGTVTEKAPSPRASSVSVLLAKTSVRSTSSHSHQFPTAPTCQSSTPGISSSHGETEAWRACHWICARPIRAPKRYRACAVVTSD
jgi:hypothetical protein